jgi:hypothetical protein
MTKEQMKKCSTSLAIKEMQIKSMLRFHLIPVGMATSRTQTTTNADKYVGKKKPSYAGGVNVS